MATRPKSRSSAMAAKKPKPRSEANKAKSVKAELNYMYNKKVGKK